MPHELSRAAALTNWVLAGIYPLGSFQAVGRLPIEFTVRRIQQNFAVANMPRATEIWLQAKDNLAWAAAEGNDASL